MVIYTMLLHYKIVEKNNMMKNNKTKRPKYGKIALITSLVIILTFVCCVFAVVVFAYSRMNYVPLVEDYTILAETESFIEDVTNPETNTSADTDLSVIEKYKNDAESAMNSTVADAEELDDVYNVLLIGSDTRQSKGTGRSDTMLLISVNKVNKQIVATSFLRDLYVKIPGRDGFDKLNAAYAYGGVELLLDTLEYNFSISIDRYIAVDFYSFIDAVDVLGGLDIDVQKNELYWCNQYIHASNLLVGDDENSDFLTKADGSFQHMNGKQSLAYARFRYVGNGDFTRTERQRKVVNLMFQKMKDVSATTLIQFLNKILPQITTNIPMNEYLSIVASLPEWGKYEVLQWGIPDDDFQYININGQSSIGIDFNHYITKMYDKIYAYDVNKNVKK